MKEKGIVEVVQVFVGMITIPLMIFQSWLMYTHVKATELMWFVLVSSWIMTIISSTLTVIINNMKKD